MVISSRTGQTSSEIRSAKVIFADYTTDEQKPLKG